ncbi:hypothetical protein HYU19_02725 [Candidatus Woesearchaeota archaeon]|nr:hypothetical protein [Candidatus Woesearchaeota archaeon]
MQHSLTRKLPNGKLVRLFVEVQDTITSLTITGDFFAHPEESIEQMEKVLLGLPKTVPASDIQQKLDAYAAENKVILVGLTTEALAGMIVEALGHD